MSDLEQEKKPADGSNEPAKEAYEPPKVCVVELAAQEALMAVCKGGFGSGPLGGLGCPGTTGPCYGSGS
jgi:hypothetical protein